MEIEVQLYASLRQYLPQGTKGFHCKLALSSPMTVKDVLTKALKMPEEALKTVMILMVNGEHAQLEKVLAEGDVLVAVPVATAG